MNKDTTFFLFLLFALIAMSVMLPAGCFRRSPDFAQISTAYPEPQTVGAVGLYESTPLRAWVVVVNGCQYAVFRNSGSSADATPVSAVHMGNCTNEIHKAKEVVVQPPEIITGTAIVTNVVTNVYQRLGPPIQILVPNEATHP